MDRDGKLRYCSWITTSPGAIWKLLKNIMGITTRSQDLLQETEEQNFDPWPIWTQPVQGSPIWPITTCHLS